LNAVILGLWLYLLPATEVFSQTVEQVKSSNAYYWGEGVGKTASLANEVALSMLISQISAKVESNFSVHTTEISGSKKSDFKQYVNSLVKTYSNATIKNTEILSWGEEPEVHVFRFVRKSEIYKIFAEREYKIKEFVAIAHKAEANCQTADALRYYYWALMLLKSHPDAGSMTMEIDGRKEKLDVYLPICINDLFDDLEFTLTGKQADSNLVQYFLQVDYKKRPVVNCEYSFFDGHNWSAVVSAKDGKGVAEMMGNTAQHKEIRVKIEYAFENEWRIDNEVYDVLHKVEPVIFKKSHINVPLIKIKNPVQAVNLKAPAYGSLNIMASAVAQIYIDDKDLGTTTPYLMSKVLAGQHHIELRAYGYEVYRQAVEVTDGGMTNIQAALQQQRIPGCEASTITLGVEFATDETWTFGNQTWSAPVTAAYCNKTTFDGGEDGFYHADCRSNGTTILNSNHFFSWCMVVNHARQLCPAPWRVPTQSDFETLLHNTTIDTFRNWGANGFAKGSFMLDIGLAYYWSTTEYTNTTYAYSLYYGGSTPHVGKSNKNFGFQVRCVK
jgi:hypothetical protein